MVALKVQVTQSTVDGFNKKALGFWDVKENGRQKTPELHNYVESIMWEVKGQSLSSTNPDRTVIFWPASWSGCSVARRWAWGRLQHSSSSPSVRSRATMLKRLSCLRCYVTAASLSEPVKQNICSLKHYSTLSDTWLRLLYHTEHPASRFFMITGHSTQYTFLCYDSMLDACLKFVMFGWKLRRVAISCFSVHVLAAFVWFKATTDMLCT